MIGIIADLPRPKIFIDSVLVSFANRDVRLANEAEHVTLTKLVRAEQLREGPGRRVEEICVESMRLDRGLLQFKTTVKVVYPITRLVHP